MCIHYYAIWMHISQWAITIIDLAKPLCVFERFTKGRVLEKQLIMALVWINHIYLIDLHPYAQSSNVLSYAQVKAYKWNVRIQPTSRSHKGNYSKTIWSVNMFCSAAKLGTLAMDLQPASSNHSVNKNSCRVDFIFQPQRSCLVHEWGQNASWDHWSSGLVRCQLRWKHFTGPLWWKQSCCGRPSFQSIFQPLLIMDIDVTQWKN